MSEGEILSGLLAPHPPHLAYGEKPLYREFHTQEQIDAEYDVEKSVPDFMVYAKHYVEASEALAPKSRLNSNASRSLSCRKG